MLLVSVLKLLVSNSLYRAPYFFFFFSCSYVPMVIAYTTSSPKNNLSCTILETVSCFLAHIPAYHAPYIKFLRQC